MSETGEAEMFSSNYCDNTEYCSQGVEGGGRGGEELWDENLKLMDSKYKLGQSLSLVSRLILSTNLQAVLLEAGPEDQ